MPRDDTRQYKMNTAEIRNKFIEFFTERNHTFVPSASTIPFDDPTILFTIAGMAQFKSCLTGQEKDLTHGPQILKNAFAFPIWMMSAKMAAI